MRVPSKEEGKNEEAEYTKLKNRAKRERK